MNDAEYIALLYQALLSREPDAPGLEHHLAILKSGGDFRTIISSIVSSEEYRGRHTDTKPPFVLRGSLDRPIMIVDVGAQMLAGEPDIYSDLLMSGWACQRIGFEPLSHRGVERKKTDPSMEILPHFIGDGSQRTFYVNNHDSTSSLLPLNLKFNAAFNHLRDLKTVRTESVITSSLDEILRSSPPIDFLKLDIQGFELFALKGATECLARTNVIHCEVEFAAIYENQPLFSEVELFVRSLGFDLIDFHSLSRYQYVTVPLPSACSERLCWGDAIFFRNLEQTKASSPTDALIQAIIATHVYKKFGLAQKILVQAGLGTLLVDRTANQSDKVLVSKASTDAHDA